MKDQEQLTEFSQHPPKPLTHRPRSTGGVKRRTQTLMISMAIFATALGAVIGKAIDGKVGAIVGGVAGAISGGLVGRPLIEFVETLTQETQVSFGSGSGKDIKEIELPAHYSWDELQSLSQPQSELLESLSKKTETVLPREPKP